MPKKDFFKYLEVAKQDYTRGKNHIKININR